MNYKPGEILKPNQVWSRTQILNRNCPVPKAPGLYAWYFNNVPFDIPTDCCLRYSGLTLLYIGIAPQETARGKSPSKATLRSRIKNHMRGNAYSSTLRLSLGSLLSEELEIKLRCVGSRKRMTFFRGEAKLSEWLERNAFVAWTVTSTPWILEKVLIDTISLPLNLQHNKKHKFYPLLKEKREKARELARELRIIQE